VKNGNRGDPTAEEIRGGSWCETARSIPRRRKRVLLVWWPEPGEGRWVPEATYPDEVWHIDLMCLWVKGRWYFLVTILDSYSRYIVHSELALSMRAQEIAEIIATALEHVHGKRPRMVRDNGSQFVAKEWREVMRYFELEEIPIRVRHPQSNGRIERYHRSVREEALGDTEAESLYRTRDLLAEWVRYYNEERLHSALNTCVRLTTTEVTRRHYWLDERRN
jgi:transposase InsO family protein